MTSRTFQNGDLATETDPRGITKQIGYGSSSYPYPTDLYEAYGTTDQLHWSLIWDPASGLLNKETDPNGTVETLTYDARGRQESSDEGGLRHTATQYNDSTQQAIISRSLAGSTVVTTTKSSDDLGRVWSSQVTDGSCAGGIQTVTLQQTPSGAGYTSQLTSNPYCTTGDPTMGWTRTTTDPLGRVVEVAHYSGGGLPAPWGSSSTTSGSVKTAYSTASSGNPCCSLYTTTDEAGVSRTTALDGLNRISSVVDAAGITSYGYDALDDLTKVYQGSQIRSFIYSSLGRLTSASNPESGTTSYTYDGDGNLQTRTDARGITATMTYNNLNQVAGKTYSDYGSSNPTPWVAYTYGNANASCPSGLGRLCNVSSNVSQTAYTYDAAGRVATSTQYTGGVTYAFTYSYNMLDGVTQEIYPSQRIINYSYDNGGRVNTVSGSMNSVTTKYAGTLLPMDPITYAPQHALATLPLGDKVTVTETWGYNARLEPTEVQVGALLTLVNCYDSSQKANCGGVTGLSPTNNGNLIGQTITRSGASTLAQSYTYDGANRLTGATEAGTNGWSQSYNYDVFGNRWLDIGNPGPVMQTSEVVSGSAGSSPYVQATNQMTSWSYDATGNLITIPSLSGNFRVASYDAENRMTSETQAGGTAKYTYDGDDRRITKTLNGVTTTYVYDAAGDLAAEYGGPTNPDSGTQYVSVDHLGSTRLVMDSSGNTKYCFDYLPFGEYLYTGTNDRGSCYPSAPADGIRFTSKERDAESGLDFFGFRYFSSAQGRWTGPDQPFADQHIEDPQSWNMYAYVRNNPLAHIDPNGKQSCAMVGNPCGYLPSGTGTAKDAAIAVGIMAGPAAIAAAPEIGAGAGLFATLRAAGSAALAWMLGHPQQVQETAAGIAEGLSGAAPGSLTTFGAASRLAANEIQTGERLATKFGLQLTESQHVGAEFVDAAGKTYDALGSERAYQFFNEKKFLGSIDAHLLKSNDYTVIDLAGASKSQVKTIQDYVGGLEKQLRDKIKYVGDQ